MYDAEREVKSIYDLVILNSRDRAINKKEFGLNIQTLLDSHGKRFGKISTLEHDFYFHFSQMATQSYIQDYRSAIETCWEAIDLMKERSFVPRSYIRLFLLQIIPFTIRLEGFQEGRKAVIEYLKIVDVWGLTLV